MRHLPLHIPRRLAACALILALTSTIFAQSEAEKKLHLGTADLPGTVKPLDGKTPAPAPKAEPKLPKAPTGPVKIEDFLIIPATIKAPSAPKPVEIPAPKPVSIPKPVPTPLPAPSPTPKAVPAPKAVEAKLPASKKLPPEAVALFTKQLNELEDRIDALTTALTDSRTTARRYKIELERQTILNRLQKSEIDRMAGKAPIAPAAPAGAPTNVKALEEKIKSLELQLRLSTIENSDKRAAAMVEKLQQIADVCRQQKLDIAKLQTSLATADATAQANQQATGTLRQQHQGELAAKDQSSATTKIALQKARVDLAASLGKVESLERELRLAKTPRPVQNVDPAVVLSLNKQLAVRDAAIKTLTTRTAKAEADARTMRKSLAVATAKNQALQSALVAAITKAAATPPAATETITPPAAVATATKPPVMKHTPVAGKITDLRENMVILNIGRTAGLIRGTRLVVYRDSTFVGYVQIDKVTDNEAYGTLSRQVVPAKIGDRVIDESTVENAG
ncbi:MAG: hypothetical protein HN909_03040 [Phycisphaerales bacterium]|nr:hypothetical protein [Phycisphaerales bacterium]MBT7170728.1 hypothetical protein [Phycisphaerales bacterium]